MTSENDLIIISLWLHILIIFLPHKMSFFNIIKRYFSWWFYEVRKRCICDIRKWSYYDIFVTSYSYHFNHLIKWGFWDQALASAKHHFVIMVNEVRKRCFCDETKDHKIIFLWYITETSFFISFCDLIFWSFSYDWGF